MSFATIAIAGAGVGLAGSVGKMIGRGKANREMEAIKRKINAMQINPEYAKQLGLTQTQLEGRMAGASQAERNIYQQGANTQANINRAATDPMQAILGAGAIQGQTSQAFNQLAGQEQADYANRLQRMMAAGMNKAQAEDALEQMKLGQTTQLSAAQQENRQNNWGDVSNIGFAAANVGMSGMGGGLGSLAGKTAAVQPSTGYVPGMGARGATPYTATGNTGVYNMFQSQSPYSWMNNTSLGMGSGSTQPYSWMQGVKFGGNQ
jgi:hypothetical protein